VIPPTATTWPRLTKSDLVKLRPGDPLVVFWAKDDDPEDVRCNYETQTVVKYDTPTQELWVREGYEWDLSRMADDETSANTTRGFVYFFRV